ncbi:MAG: carboxypeptidase-like regulatory domain-containing protein [Pirellulaceae bacterium]|nr:carboxypeptidase regulatory-like domain-containing protein [Planctomycetales bacterium]
MWKTWVSSLWMYLRGATALRDEQIRIEIADELSFHLQERIEEYLLAGMTLEAARDKALRRFGNVARIAEDCRRTALQQITVWHRIHLAATIILAVTMIAMCYRMFVLFHEFEAPTMSRVVSALMDNDWTGDVRGQILDTASRPIEGAHVLVVVKAWPDGSYMQRAYVAITDEHGDFDISDVHPTNDDCELQIAVVANNRELRSTYYRLEHRQLDRITMRLSPSPNLELRLDDFTGQAIRNAEILPCGRLEPNGEQHIVYFDSAGPIIRRTDTDGRVQLPYYHPGDIAKVLVRLPQGEWQSYEVAVPTENETVSIAIEKRRSNSPKDPI